MLDSEVMTMIFWPVMVVGSIVVILLAAVAGGPRLFVGTRRRSESFHCPFVDRDVTADFEVSEWDGSALCVHTCSAFAPPRAIRCDRRCLAGRVVASAEVGAR